MPMLSNKRLYSRLENRATQMPRMYGIGGATFHKYKAGRGCMVVSDTAQLRVVKAEDARLKSRADWPMGWSTMQAQRN